MTGNEVGEREAGLRAGIQTRNARSATALYVGCVLELIKHKTKTVVPL